MADIVLDTIPALLAVCNASAALADVKVVDGPAVAKGSEKQRLFIGTSEDGTGVGAEGDNAAEVMPGVVDVETFSISCLAEAWGGSNDLVRLRQQVFGIRNTVKGLLRPSLANVILGVSAIQASRMGSWRLTQIQDESGAYVRVTFRCEFIARPATS